MADQRLPIVDGDDGDWGDILNQFLEKEHVNTGSNDAGNGGHKKITIQAGTATAGTAPLKFTSGTVLSSPEPGAIEFNTNRLYFTNTSSVRKVLAAYDDTSGAEGDIYYRDSSGNFVRLGIGSNGHVLTVASGLPSWAAASGGGGGGLTWNTVTGTSQTAAVDNGYITNNAGQVTVTLPATAAVGKTVAIAGQGAGGWKLAQPSGQIIYFGSATTTSGTGGYLASTHRRDCVTLVCITANTEWEVYSSVGSITYV